MLVKMLVKHAWFLFSKFAKTSFVYLQFLGSKCLFGTIFLKVSWNGFVEINTSMLKCVSQSSVYMNGSTLG